ncbi:hypothetical protein GCM10008174_04240 [Methylopila turkensis]|uniref:Uncharacterized protein n=1 Tax=Methylopila turkensis TaxID=1437816 RepID=A0A9W6JNF7_9HYPH|nr:hypothetical protein GCM10008174_04240 [Methylopila turkensis]
MVSGSAAEAGAAKAAKAMPTASAARRVMAAMEGSNAARSVAPVWDVVESGPLSCALDSNHHYICRI